MTQREILIANPELAKLIERACEIVREEPFGWLPAAYQRACEENPGNPFSADCPRAMACLAIETTRAERRFGNRNLNAEIKCAILRGEAVRDAG